MPLAPGEWQFDSPSQLFAGYCWRLLSGTDLFHNYRGQESKRHQASDVAVIHTLALCDFQRVGRAPRGEGFAPLSAICFANDYDYACPCRSNAKDTDLGVS